jgi:hypothetical protein
VGISQPELFGAEAERPISSPVHSPQTGLRFISWTEAQRRLEQFGLNEIVAQRAPQRSYGFGQQSIQWRLAAAWCGLVLTHDIEAARSWGDGRVKHGFAFLAGVEVAHQAVIAHSCATR